MATNERGGVPTSVFSTPRLSAHVETDESGTTTCTIYPSDASEEERSTAWISADEGSYVDFTELR